MYYNFHQCLYLHELHFFPWVKTLKAFTAFTLQCLIFRSHFFNHINENCTQQGHLYVKWRTTFRALLVYEDAEGVKGSKLNALVFVSYANNNNTPVKLNWPWYTKWKPLAVSGPTVVNLIVIWFPVLKGNDSPMKEKKTNKPQNLFLNLPSLNLTDLFLTFSPHGVFLFFSFFSLVSKATCLV